MTSPAAAASPAASSPAASPATGWRLVRERARLGETATTAAAVMLALACLIPLFADLSWVLRAMVMVAVVAALGAASRALAMPVPLVPLVAVLGLVVVLTAMFTGALAVGGFVPTHESWQALGALVQQGMADAEAFAAPAPTFPGLVLLAVAGAGLAALCADTLFVSVRSPILAGLPLLALYLAGALMPQVGGPWWGIVPAAAGWLLILAADQRDRIRDWAGWSSSAPVRGLAVAGRRVGLVAVAVAVLAGIVLPAAGGPWRPQGDDGGAGTAAAPSDDEAPVVLDPLVSLRRSIIAPSDTEVLRYRTDAPRPSYLRLSVLEEFDGTAWLPRAGLATGRDAGVPLTADVLDAAVALDPGTRGVTGGQTHEYAITVTGLANAFLPLPYPLTAIGDVGGLGSRWRFDPATGTAFSADTPASGRSFEVTAWDRRIEPERLQDAPAARGEQWPLLNLPGGLSPRIGRLAREVTADADTPYERALLLQRWFTTDGGFAYSTDVRSGAGADYLEEFLRDRIGYCEQFSAAMAVMARSLGIPSRVVVGFTQGTPDGQGQWRVTARDAHAWPELWFDGVGWVRFEPTPRAGATVQAPEYAPVEQPARGGDDTRGPVPADGAEPVAEEESPTLVTWLRATVRALAPVALLGTAVIVLMLAAWPMAARRWRRRRRLADAGTIAEGAWAELGDLAHDLGQPWSPQRTPRQCADRLVRGMPEAAAAAVQRLRREVEGLRYARPRGEVSPQAAAEHAEAIRADLRVVEAELRSRVRRGTRIAAYCWPSSERRRQRSSMRSMKPGPEEVPGAGSGAGVASAGRAPKAE